jgi:transposase InsO family protein
MDNPTSTPPPKKNKQNSDWNKLRYFTFTDDTYQKFALTLEGRQSGEEDEFEFTTQEENVLELLALDLPDFPSDLVAIINDEMPPWLVKVRKDDDQGQELARTSEYRLKVVPKSKIYDVVDSYYTDPRTGSFRGIKSLYNKLRSVTVGITQKDVKEYLAEKETSQVFKPAPSGTVVKPIITSHPLEHFQADLVVLKTMAHEAPHGANANRSKSAKAGKRQGPLGEKYILVVVDIFSKYVWLRPLRQKTGDAVAQLFSGLYYDGFVPKILHTDNGSEFQNQELADLNKIFNIETRFGEPYKSTSQGAVERANGTIKTTLYKMFTESGETNWDELLPDIQFAYNTTVHTTHNLTPHQVQFGVDITNQVANYKSEINPGTQEQRISAISNYSLLRRESVPSEEITETVAQEEQLFRQDAFAAVRGGIDAQAQKMLRESQKIINQKLGKTKIDEGDFVRVRMNIRNRTSGETAKYYERNYRWSRALFQVVKKEGDIEPFYTISLIAGLQTSEVSDELNTYEIKRKYAISELQKIDFDKLGAKNNRDKMQRVSAQKRKEVERYLKPAGVRKRGEKRGEDDEYDSE